MNYGMPAARHFQKTTLTLAADNFTGVFSGQSSLKADIQQLINRMERDEFDLIAVGRALISDADWVAKIRDGNSASMKNFDAGRRSATCRRRASLAIVPTQTLGR
jgi:2,4-dienoyl-CoA reductase-like NADH-dependent reductase (Old Yellow Enzyme family)